VYPLKAGCFFYVNLDYFQGQIPKYFNFHSCLLKQLWSIITDATWADLEETVWATLTVSKVNVHFVQRLHVLKPLKHSAMARIIEGSHSFTCTPHISSAIRVNHTCLYFPSRNWYSFT